LLELTVQQDREIAPLEKAPIGPKSERMNKPSVDNVLGTQTVARESADSSRCRRARHIRPLYTDGTLVDVNWCAHYVGGSGCFLDQRIERRAHLRSCRDAPRSRPAVATTVELCGKMLLGQYLHPFPE
jgi:hypothetical protein